MKKLLFLFALVISVPVYSQNETSAGNFDPEVMKNTFYGNGVYANLHQFLTGSPEEDIPLCIRGNRFMYNDGVTDRLRMYTKPAWGACINNQVYIKHGSKIVLVQPAGKIFIFYKSFPDVEPKRCSL